MVGYSQFAKDLLQCRVTIPSDVEETTAKLIEETQ